MSPPVSNRLMTKAHALLRGLGEILAFLMAAVSALTQFALGRWPQIRKGRARPKARQPHPHRKAGDKATPFPTHD